MSRMIDIEDAKTCADIAIKWGWSLREFRESMEQWNDTIELVRCKDCEKYKYGICTRKGMCVNVPLDFWCAEGRKQCQQTIEQKEAQPAAGEATVISDDWLRGDAPELSNNPQKLDNENGELQPWEVLLAQAIPERPEQTEQGTTTMTVGRTRGETTMWYECSECGEPVDQKDNFCRNCGKRFKK